MIEKGYSILLILTLVLTLVLSCTACGAKGEDSTITGMVLSVDGTVLSILETDGDFSETLFSGTERPEMPEGTGEAPEGFDPEIFNGELPEMPEGMGENFSAFDPENFSGEIPEMPEGMTMPESGEISGFAGEGGGTRPGPGSFGENMESTEIDIGDAHISMEDDGIKVTGSLSDITAGCMVTITVNSKGKVTNVLIGSRFQFNAF